MINLQTRVGKVGAEDFATRVEKTQRDNSS